MWWGGHWDERGRFPLVAPPATPCPPRRRTLSTTRCPLAAIAPPVPDCWDADTCYCGGHLWNAMSTLDVGLRTVVQGKGVVCGADDMRRGPGVGGSAWFGEFVGGAGGRVEA